MKKALVFGLVCTLCLTGCGDKESASKNDKKEDDVKKLTCTITEIEEGMTGEDEIIFVFDKKGNEIQKGSRAMNIEVDEEYTSYIEEIADSAEESFEDIEDFADIDIKTSKNTITVKVSYEVDGLSEEELEELEYAEVYISDMDYDEIKEELEDAGYTCK